MPESPRSIRRATALALALPLVAGSMCLPPARAAGPASGSSLSNTVSQDRRREAALSSSAAALGVVIKRLDRGQAVLAARLGAVQSELDSTLARLHGARADLQRTREHLRRLTIRLARGRETLSGQLRAQYTSPQPDLVNVVLRATSFSDLLDQAEFLRRVARSNAEVVSSVRRVRDTTEAQRIHLTVLQATLRDDALAASRQRNALAVMNRVLLTRRAGLARARAARLTALHNTVASRRRAERQLRRLTAQQAQSTSTAGPGGPWAIPWAIVQCESGGQNLPPNYATASGYYQMTDATWHGLGGRTAHAFEASKGEQDAAAARLWAGGSGASNWVCAAMVGR